MVRASAVGDVVRHAREDARVRPQAIRALRARLEDGDPAVRGAAALGLGDLGDTEALPMLLVAVEDEDLHVGQHALMALAELADDRALPRVRRALSDPRAPLRYQAVVTFARLAREDHPGVESALLDALADEDRGIRYVALRLVEEHLDAGGELSPVLVAKVRGFLAADGEKASGDLAVVAAIVLAKSGDGTGRDLLLEVARRGTCQGATVQKDDEGAALEATGALGLREVVPDLERRAWGLGTFLKDTCPWSARVALARLGHERAVEEIRRDLEGARRDRVDAAVVAVGRAGLVALAPRLRALQAAGEADPDLLREALTLLQGAPRP